MRQQGDQRRQRRDHGGCRRRYQHPRVCVQHCVECLHNRNDDPRGHGNARDRKCQRSHPRRQRADDRHDGLVLIDEVRRPGQRVGAFFREAPQHWQQLVAHGDLQRLHGALQELHLALVGVELDVAHFLCRAVAVLDGLRQRVPVRRAGVHDGQQALHALLSGELVGVALFFLVGQGTEGVAQVVQHVGELPCGAVRLEHLDVQILHGLGGVFIRAGHPRERGGQRRAGHLALQTAVGHGAQRHGHVVDGVVQGPGCGGHHLEGRAHKPHVGVGGCRRLRQHVGEVGRVLALQPEGGERVGDDVAHGAQLLAGRRRKAHDPRQAAQHGAGVPSGHGHVVVRAGHLLRREDAACRVLLGRLRELRQLLIVGAADGGNARHGVLELPRDLHALSQRLHELLEAPLQPAGDQGGCQRAQGVVHLPGAGPGLLDLVPVLVDGRGAAVRAGLGLLQILVVLFDLGVGVVEGGLRRGQLPLPLGDAGLGGLQLFVVLLLRGGELLRLLGKPLLLLRRIAGGVLQLFQRLAVGPELILQIRRVLPVRGHGVLRVFIGFADLPDLFLLLFLDGLQRLLLRRQGFQPVGAVLEPGLHLLQAALQGLQLPGDLLDRILVLVLALYRNLCGNLPFSHSLTVLNIVVIRIGAPAPPVSFRMHLHHIQKKAGCHAVQFPPRQVQHSHGDVVVLGS